MLFFSEATPRVIAFSAHHPNIHDYADDEVVIFTRTYTNFGNGYSTLTGKFTCETDGLYLFTLSLLQQSSTTKRLECAIVLEGYERGEVYVNGHGENDISDQSSITTLVECRAGQKVWVQVDDTDGGPIDVGYNLSMFSGAMIFPLDL